jgi:DNA-binding GntR family transcriptional regulator
MSFKKGWSVVLFRPLIFVYNLYTIFTMESELESCPSTKRTAAEQVYCALKRDIITLRHRPGESLTEQQLASLYGTSRVPVREACRRLDQEGLLTGRPYRGFSVNQISLKEIGDCFDLRLGLEVRALELAAERATPDDLERLSGLATTEYTYHDWDSYIEFLDRNLDFHIQLAALSRNDRLVSVLRDLLASMQRFFFLGLDLGDFASEMRSEHEELVALLSSGKSVEAAASLSRQILSSRDRILRALIEDKVDLPIE